MLLECAGSFAAGARQGSAGGLTTLQQLPPFEQLVRLPRSADDRAAQPVEPRTTSASANGVPAGELLHFSSLKVCHFRHCQGSRRPAICRQSSSR